MEERAPDIQEASMPNRTVRSIALVGTTVLVLLALGPAASAKCMPGAPECPMVVVARGTIEGIDQQGGAPITFDDDDFWTVARRAGLASYRPSGGAISEPPAPAALGPRHRMDLRVRLSNGDRFAAAVDVYPYAPNPFLPGTSTAWVRIPSGLMFVEAFDEAFDGEFVGGAFHVEPGWYRSTSLHQTLVDLGLPEASAVSGGSSVGAPEERAGTEGSTTATWALLAALLALLVGGALVGRAGRAPAGGRVRPS
jgi:hypothetical protein